jgi:hypothetical protein
LPSVNKLYTALRDKGLEVLLVTFREDPGLVKKTAADRGYVAPVLIDRSGDTTGRVWGVFGPPTVYFIDRQGRLVGRAVGAKDWESEPMRRLVESLVQSSQGR